MSEPRHFGVPERQPLPNSEPSHSGLTGRNFVLLLAVIGLAGLGLTLCARID
jgi:hypothetical protein